MTPIAVALVVVATVALVTVAFHGSPREGPRRVARESASPAGVELRGRVPALAQAVRRELPTVSSYDYRTIAIDEQHALEQLTASYASSYRRFFDGSVLGAARRTHAVVKAHVLSVGVARLQADGGVCLVALDQTSTSTQISGTRHDRQEVSVTLRQEHGTLRISDIVTGGAPREDRDPVLRRLEDAAAADATAYSTYDYRNIGAFRTRMQQISTGSFAAQLRTQIESVISLIQQGRGVASGMVTGAALIDLNEHATTAHMLVFVDDRITNAALRRATLRRYRFTLTLQKTSSGYGLAGLITV